VIEVAALECPLIILLESALGIERAFELASAHPAVRFLAFGPLDLLADLGGHWSREGEETLYARQRVAIAARAARTRGALDGPWPELEDLEGLRADTARGRRMGYVGRMVIHPRQIAVVADAFRPSAEELAFARSVLAAVADGEREGRAALRVDGRFIDAPVVRWAEHVLADSKQRDLEAAGLRAGRASREAGR
jgi:citrate lyase subunit beta/citryl-CoA lyase